MEYEPKTRQCLDSPIYLSDDGGVTILLTPPSAQYLTSDKTSFAFVSAHDRWPVIIVSGVSFLPFSSKLDVVAYLFI